LNAYLKKLFSYAGRRLFGKGLIFVGFKLLRFYGQTLILIDIKIKQLVTLYNSVNLIFLNTSGLNNILTTRKVHMGSKQSTIGNKKVKRLYDLTSGKPLPAAYRTKPKFIRRTLKLTPYNSAITEPDFRSYT
jgi:hypothetical protein